MEERLRGPKSKKSAQKIFSLSKIYISCWRDMLAEGIGTFILVFAGTGAIIVNTITDGTLTHLGVSFVFGAVVAALIYTLGHISGAHFNPAVTLGFCSCGFFSRGKIACYVVCYLLAQCLGAIAASTILLITFGKVANLGATLPLDDNWSQTFILETILTFILMLVILGSGLDRRAHKSFAGLAIGLTIGLEAACMGPITGASMNPARSLGPALVAAVWQFQWVYWLAPILGAQLATIVYRQISSECNKS
ncbi:MAG: aquaporin [Prochloraceae cyanobacterium]|nr:aquaporin [Prochloraceae cyanobacterium]